MKQCLPVVLALFACACISMTHAQHCNADDVQLAVMDRQEKRLQNCLQSNPELDLRTGAGHTSLNIAATLGQDRVVNMLLQHRYPPQADGQPDESKYAPIHTCVQNGHVAAAKLLIASLKSQPGAVDVRTAGGFTPLHFAAREGHLEIVKLLLDAGADINAQESDGDTPLHLSIDRIHHPVSKLLISKKPRVDVRGLEKLTPLVFAVAKGDIEMVRLLLEQKPPPNPNLRDKFGSTALEIAVTAGYIDIVRALLEHEPAPTLLDRRTRLITATLIRKSGYHDIADEIENLKIDNNHDPDEL